MTTVIEKIASALSALHNCERTGNVEWQRRWNDTLDHIERNVLPSGSGIDQGVTIDRNNPLARVVRLYVPFHHMNEHGYYTRWENYTVDVTPDWDGIEIKIHGKDRNAVKDYLGDLFQTVLMSEIERGAI